MLLTTDPGDEPSTRFNSAAVDVTPSKMFSSAAVEVTSVSEPEVPMYSAGVLSSEVDFAAFTIKAELAVVVPCTWSKRLEK